DRGCARTPWGRQAGTKKRPFSAEPRNIPGGMSPLLRQGLGSLNPCQTARRQIIVEAVEIIFPVALIFIDPSRDFFERRSFKPTGSKLCRTSARDKSSTFKYFEVL